MKRYICSTFDWDSEYIPPEFTHESVGDVMHQLDAEIKRKYGRRYKNLGVDYDDIAFDGGRLSITVYMYNNGKLVGDGVFSFYQYDDYFDESDYTRHLNTSISRFVGDLI